MRQLTLCSLLTLSLALAACSSSNTINASWMSDYSKQLGPKTLTQVALPGSHYSNAYGLIDNKNLVVCNGENYTPNMSNNAKLAHMIAGESNPNTREFISYLNTQGHDIKAQLNNGIRYLEIQICLQNATYYTSNYYLTANLESIIQQIKSFIDDNDKELIIIDLDNNLRSDYGEMNQDDINSLHNYLQMQFGSYLTPKQDWQQITFSKLWQSKHRIIIFSSNPIMLKYYDVWNKNEIVLPERPPHYTTIKKLTGIQEAIQSESAALQSKFSIIPIYSWYDAELNNPAQIKSNTNDHLIIDYLYSLPTNAPLNIIVSDHQYIRPLVEYTVKKDVAN